jgi:hypothetical protein
LPDRPIEQGKVISPTFKRPVVALALRVRTWTVWTVLFTRRFFRWFGLEKAT